ncbi:ABC transporter ATP-binding protein [Azorhizobium oxalatiphilum]|uniref:ABC transporter ATP-binding protein n=1 Tax=Azorhizobium oxalatiphilum TaxID=980631 RepID=A0A917BXF2_9HYPH|nr:ABC transporter ATP-binding protein [Azorhizobium oxalatiphilum]GGF58575.1 ABC transporter ATP-binding protein [Azorhizobium oxalatiphilum]
MAGEGIIVDNVSRIFGGLRAVDGASLKLARGETVAIVGPNGAGKSTLVQLISGVDKADSGTIHVDGVRTDRLPPDRIARLGVGRSFQTSRVFPALSVWDSVLVGVQPRLIATASGRLLDPVTESLGALLGLPFWRRRVAAQEAAAETALKLFGDRLWPRRDQPALGLSYANRRRLEIARLLAAEPRYLLLDEPSAGMNPTETEELTQLILDLRRSHPHMGILVIEHKLSLVRRIADRVVVLNQGKVLIEDTPDHALDHPEVVEAYLGRPRAGSNFQDAHHG